MTYPLVREQLWMAAAWWSEAQAGFRFSTPRPYCYDTFNNEDPGAVQGRCLGESSGGILTDYFPTGDYAHIWWTYGWHSSCDFWGLNMDTWRMAIGTNQDGYDCHAPAPSTRGWAFAKAEEREGRPVLFLSAAHEFGHVMGLDHSNDHPYSLMYGLGGWNGMRLSNDDADGVYNGLDEGRDVRPLKTVKATLSGSTLTFGSIQTISGTSVLWNPAIAADHPTYNFVLAWVHGFDYSIRLGLVNQNSNGNLGTVTTKVLNEYSRAPVGVAVTPGGKIGVAFSGSDDAKTVNFAVSSDNGTTWTKTTLWGYGALGGVALTYQVNAARWTISWVMDAPETVDHRNIVTRTSDDSSGANWSEPVWSYGDELTMPYGRPSLACARNSYMPQRDKCMMLFKTYATYYKRTQSMAFQANSQDFGLDPMASPQDFDGGKRTYVTTNMFYVMPGSDLSPGKYVALYVPNELSPGRLSYAVKSESELGSGNFGFPAAKTWTNGPTTRSGFAGIYSEKKNAVRLVWKDE